MRRFLSWVVFILAMRIISSVGYGIIYLFFLFVDWLGDKSTGILITFILLAGSLCLGILFLPITLGIPAAVKCSETICLSRTGARYRVYAIIEIVIVGLLLIGCIFGITEFQWQNIYYLVLFVMLLISYKDLLGEVYGTE